MRSAPSALQGSGWLGQSACGLLPTPSSTHIFAGLQTYGLLIRPAKTSHTAGTLCAIRAKIIGKFLQKINKILDKFFVFLVKYSQKE
jgi:hypothetical protein